MSEDKKTISENNAKECGTEPEVLLSVVSAVYNTAPYLGEMIESVLAQDLTGLEKLCAPKPDGGGYKDIFEFILVDDGSTDGSADILDEYAQKSGRIRVIHKENGGVSSARNTGIAAARGKYITFPDADDRLSETVFRDCLMFLEEQKEPVAFAAYPMRYFDKYEGEHWTNFRFEAGTRVVDLDRQWDQPMYFANSAFFRLRDIQGRISFDTGLRIGEDSKFVQEVLFNTTTRIGLVSTCSYGYRIRSAGELSVMQESQSRNDFYIPYVSGLLEWMLLRAKEKYGRVPKYVQYAAMGQLQWRFAKNDAGRSGRQAVGEKVYQTYKKLCLSLLAYMDDDVILAQKQIWSEHFCYIFRHKYAKEPETVHEGGNIYYVFNGTRVPFGLADIYTRLDSLKIQNGCLHIEGCSMNYAPDVELLIRVNGKIASYDGKETQIYKYSFDDGIMFAKPFAIDIPPEADADEYRIRFFGRAGGIEVEKFPMRFGEGIPPELGSSRQCRLEAGWTVKRPKSGIDLFRQADDTKSVKKNEPADSSGSGQENGTDNNPKPALKETRPQEKMPLHISALITARTDIKNLGNEENNLEIYGLSGENAACDAPAWFRDSSGTGYVVSAQTMHPSGDTLSFTLRCIQDGVLVFRLRGMSVPNPDKGARFPYWIDYMSFKVNGREALARPVCVCHDFPFDYRKNVKNGEIVKISVLFKSHASGDLTKGGREEWNFDLRKLARIDLVNKDGGQRDFEWLELSDPDACLLKPAWFNKNQNGYLLASDKGEIRFRIKCKGDGTFLLALRGADKKDENGKRVPLWVDYQSLTINGQCIFCETKSLWCDKPYTVTQEVKDGEEISCLITWSEHIE